MLLAPFFLIPCLLSGGRICRRSAERGGGPDGVLRGVAELAEFSDIPKDAVRYAADAANKGKAPGQLTGHISDGALALIFLYLFMYGIVVAHDLVSEPVYAE